MHLILETWRYSFFLCPTGNHYGPMAIMEMSFAGSSKSTLLSNAGRVLWWSQGKSIQDITASPTDGNDLDGFITLISHEGHGISNHWQLNCVFNSLFWPRTMKISKLLNVLAMEHDDVLTWKCFPYYCPFVRGIHRWPVDSPHKGPVMRKPLPCRNVIMNEKET